MSRKYGNDKVWCFLEDGWETTRPLEIWQAIGLGHEEVIAHCTDKFSAMTIVDALVLSEKISDEPDNKLTKRENTFLRFVASECAEPWATMANNAITWNDRDAFEKLKAKFNEIY